MFIIIESVLKALPLEEVWVHIHDQIDPEYIIT